MRHRHRRHRPWFRAAIGIHRRILVVLLLALLAGAASSWGLSAATAAGVGPWGLTGLICVALTLFWPATWAATWMVARPLRRLADIASEIRRGDLESRARLPAGPDEVGEVGEALRGVAERVERQLADQRALMATVSHELRSPLARARVLVELSRDGRAVADELDAEISAMDTLVGDLLAAARVDFEAVRPRPIDALDLANRAVQLSGVPASLQAEPQLPRVLADPTLAARALVLLLDNARRHGGGTIAVKLGVEGDQVAIDVLDDGPGFGANPAEAFAPFWRKSPESGGQGLGLALVRHIAEAHGGSATAADRPEGGARVRMTLPVAR